MQTDESKKNGADRTNVRCECGKIICQYEKSYLVVKCRHCKRLVILNLESKMGHPHGYGKRNADD